ncbi:hypothetical protein [Nonomuraea jabiensis]|uniref:Uncharacterized protein n=1 Tax=Nonomuraea jabiensis TaxID=882448 RepID=A0A7W9GCE2_9ACTN|nr:hypothetical protein [Nonomuraea jabiensis]MBB5781201.1 hypothetical protein [Nonomuraea jabiensis]
MIAIIAHRSSTAASPPFPVQVVVRLGYTDGEARSPLAVTDLVDDRFRIPCRTCGDQ